MQMTADFHKEKQRKGFTIRQFTIGITLSLTALKQAFEKSNFNRKS